MGLKVKISEDSIDNYRLEALNEKMAKALSLLPKNLVVIESGTIYIFDPKLGILPSQHRWYHTYDICMDWRRAIGTILVNRYRKTYELSVESRLPEYDDILKIVAIELAKYFDVEFTIAKYEGQNETKNIGTLKCQYCGQFTTNVLKCTHCNGVPI
jgi:hypothetical protein